MIKIKKLSLQDKLTNGSLLARSFCEVEMDIPDINLSQLLALLICLRATCCFMIKIVKKMTRKDRTDVKKAEEFIRTFYWETEKSEQQFQQRMDQIAMEIHTTGTYIHTTDELTYGAKLAWRNSNKCIGRLFWQTLHVIDKRDKHTEQEIYEALLEHIQFATNEGRIKPTITVFDPKSVRIWNHQLTRYAGYITENGVIGDSSSIDFTNQCISLGWKAKWGRFDMLPLVIQVDNNPPMLFEIPEEYLV